MGPLMGALTAEGALIYDENVSRQRPAVLLEAALLTAPAR
jgi:hypothetical protein